MGPKKKCASLHASLVVLGLGRVEKGETREERAIIFIVLLAALLAEMKLLIDNNL